MGVDLQDKLPVVVVVVGGCLASAVLSNATAAT